MLYTHANHPTKNKKSHMKTSGHLKYTELK